MKHKYRMKVRGDYRDLDFDHRLAYMQFITASVAETNKTEDRSHFVIDQNKEYIYVECKNEPRQFSGFLITWEKVY